MKQVVLLKTLADLEMALSLNLFEHAKAVALSFETAYSLKLSNRAFTPVWEYFDFSEMILALKDRDWFIHEFWMRFFRENTAYGEYGRVGLFPLIYFVDEAIVSRLAIQKILSEERPAKIVNFTGPKNVPCTEAAWEFCVFDAILEYECACSAIEYVEKSRPIKPVPTRASQSTATLWNRMTHYGIGLLLLPYWGFGRFVYGRRPILSLVSRQEQKSRHQWLFDRLDTNGGCKVAALWKKPGIYLKYWSEGLLARAVDRHRAAKEYHKVKNAFQAYRKNVKVHSEFIANPALEFQWDYLLHVVVDMKVEAQRRARRLKRVANPKAMITSQAHQPMTVASSLAFHEMDIPTLLVPHATIPYEQMLYYDYHNWVLATGKFPEKALRKAGATPDSIIAIKDGRYAHLQKQIGNARFTKDSRPEWGQRSDEPPTIAVFTRNIQKGTGLFPKDDVLLSMEKAYGFFCACRDLVDVISQCHLVFKSHPLRDYYGLYDQFAAGNGNIAHIRKESAESVLHLSQIAIFAGALTDVIFSAASMGKAIIFCDSGYSADLVAALEKGAVVVKDPRGLAAAVKRVLDNLPTFSKMSQKIVDEFLIITQSETKGADDWLRSALAA